MSYEHKIKSQCVFKYLPGEYVTINHLGFRADGRITRSILSHDPNPIYEVEHNHNGDLKTGEFYEDEIYG